MADYSSRVFLTAEIANLLKLAEWRIARFSEQEAFRISPSVTDSAGSGTRRIYNLEDVCQIALTARVLNVGVGMRTAGNIVAALRSKQSLSARLQDEDKEMKTIHLAIFVAPGNGKLSFSGRSEDVDFACSLLDVQKEYASRPDSDLLFLYVGNIFRQLKQKLARAGG